VLPGGHRIRDEKIRIAEIVITCDSRIVFRKTTTALLEGCRPTPSTAVVSLGGVSAP
jgi:hypothetical protein